MPIAVNAHNVSSLKFQVGHLEDFSEDFLLRQKEWPNYLPESVSASPTKPSFAYYMDLSVDQNPNLCFQDVVIQRSPTSSTFSSSASSSFAPVEALSRPQYGRDFFVLGIPVRVMCEINQQLTKDHSIPVGSCRTILKGDHYWILVRPPPAYPPQVCYISINKYPDHLLYFFSYNAFLAC